MKRWGTEEQRAAAKERRQRMYELAKRVAAMSAEQRAAFDQNFYTTIEGRVLSPHNQIMLAMQDQKSALVGGYNQWKKVGRYVRAGEHGAAIWIPLNAPKADEQADDREIQFGMATVFGLDQTDTVESDN